MVRADGICQLGKSLHCDHDDSISVPRTHLKEARHMFITQTLGRQKTNKQWTVLEGHLRSSSPHTHAYTHRNVCTHVNRHTNTCLFMPYSGILQGTEEHWSKHGAESQSQQTSASKDLPKQCIFMHTG